MAAAGSAGTSDEGDKQIITAIGSGRLEKRPPHRKDIKKEKKSVASGLGRSGDGRDS